MTKCSHNEYWKGHYGTCMICRAEKAEKLADRYTELMAHANALAKALEWIDESDVPLHFNLPDNVQQALFDFQDFKKKNP